MTNQELMAKIKADWGGHIAAAIQGTPIPASFLGAIIANESNGEALTKRFERNVFAQMKAKHADWSEDRLVDNASSWGLTQIMGWEYPGHPLQLVDATTGLQYSVFLLAQFAQRWKLDLGKDFEKLFDCWNTGAPAGETYDPQYAANGIARMALWPS